MREIARPRLSERTTIGLGGTARAELLLEQPEDLLRIRRKIEDLGATPIIFGAGSNMLCEDCDLDLVILRPHFDWGPFFCKDAGEATLIRVGAGVPMPRLLRYCMSRQLSGLEGLIGIPGNVGGAIAMNAGSFGMSVCDCLESLKVFCNGGLHVFFRADFCVKYRQFALESCPPDFLIVEATFALTHSDRHVIFNRMNHDFFIKKSRQPLKAKSAGCIFKNPAPGIAAGKLLEAAGFRGKRRGGMLFSPVHANFLVNDGNGTSAEAFALVQEAQEAVSRLFGLELELEVKVIKCPSP